MSTSTWMKQIIKEAEKHLDYHVEGAALNFAEQVCGQMEKQKINKAELARRLNKSRAYVTKVLGGTYNNNLTLKTMVSFAMILGRELDIQLTSATSEDVEWVQHTTTSTQKSSPCFSETKLPVNVPSTKYARALGAYVSYVFDDDLIKENNDARENNPAKAA